MNFQLLNDLANFNPLCEKTHTPTCANPMWLEAVDETKCNFYAAILCTHCGATLCVSCRGS